MPARCVSVVPLTPTRCRYHHLKHSRRARGDSISMSIKISFRLATVRQCPPGSLRHRTILESLADYLVPELFETIRVEPTSNLDRRQSGVESGRGADFLKRTPSLRSSRASPLAARPRSPRPDLRRPRRPRHPPDPLQPDHCANGPRCGCKRPVRDLRAEGAPGGSRGSGCALQTQPGGRRRGRCWLLRMQAGDRPGCRRWCW